LTTITITIDDPNGLNSDLFFPSALPYQMSSAFGATGGNSGSVQFHRFSAGTVDPTALYELAGTGNSIEAGDFVDVQGHFNSLRLTRDPFGSGATIMHATFALDGAWAARGGVFLNSLSGLTVDVLMARVQQLTSANLVLVGNVGNDVLNGSFLDDTLRGGPGGDRLNGGEGSDTASYEFSSAGVTVNLATGTSSGADAARDQFSSIENLLGSSFNDRLTGSAAANFIDGGLGFDTIDGGAGNDFIFGRNGGGVLRGGAGNDRVDGGIDADTIYGGTGNDELRVGTGSNFAYGEDGNDFLLGDTGIDRLYGGAGTDILDGVAGNDILDGGAGSDTMLGGTGASRYYVDSAGDKVFDSGIGDGDLVLASISFALTLASAIERFSTTNASGTSALNLTGNETAQTIQGNNGANILNGREGADTLQGFGGSDSFLFNTTLGATNIDRIVDFNVAADTIRLENAVFTGLSAGTLGAAAFFAGAAAHDSSDRILYNAASGALSFDKDGLGGAAAVRFATVGTGLALTNADFLIV